MNKTYCFLNIVFPLSNSFKGFLRFVDERIVQQRDAWKPHQNWMHLRNLYSSFFRSADILSKSSYSLFNQICFPCKLKVSPQPSWTYNISKWPLFPLLSKTCNLKQQRILKSRWRNILSGILDTLCATFLSVKCFICSSPSNHCAKLSLIDKTKAFRFKGTGTLEMWRSLGT